MSELLSFDKIKDKFITNPSLIIKLKADLISAVELGKFYLI